MAAILRKAGCDFDALCAGIQAIVCRDIGSRGIAQLMLPAQLQRAAQNFVLAPSVVILTGFPCRVTASPPTETDGPPGAVALASAARALGKPTAIATDDSSASVMRACIEAWECGPHVGEAIDLLAFPPGPAWGAHDAARLEAAALKYCHAIAIERAGRASDGSYRTMRGIPMDSLVAPLDDLMTRGCACEDRGCGKGGAAKGGCELPWRTSTGIGDGGNECGMGSVRSAVVKHIPLGEEIGCVVPCDALLAAGVSNWGGWGLITAAEGLARIAWECAAVDPRSVARAATHAYSEGAGHSGEFAVAAVINALVAKAHTVEHEAMRRLSAEAPGSLLPTDAAERRIAAAMEIAGARDGITGAGQGSVDGMPHSLHLGVLAQLRTLLVDRPCSSDS